MYAIASSILQVVVFLHEEMLVTVDQLSFTRKGRMETNESIVPLVDQVKPISESSGARMYSSLMGTFDIPATINYLGSSSVGKSITAVGDKMDPWVLSSHNEPKVPLQAVEVAYQAISNTTIDPVSVPPTVSEDPGEAYLPSQEENSLCD